jgi:hypothetical protein
MAIDLQSLPIYLNEDHPRAHQPLGFEYELKPHQLTSLYQMKKLDQKNCRRVETEETITKIRSNMGILGDIVGYGKCHGKGTPILMYDGKIKPVEKIQPGEKLMGDDSTPRIIYSTCHGVGKLYKIIPTKGDPYIVNGHHILSLKMSGTTRLIWHHDKKGRKRYQVFWFDKDNIMFRSKSFSVKQQGKRKSIALYETKEEAYKNACAFRDTLTPDSVIDISVERFLKLPTQYKKELKGYKVGVRFNKQDVKLDPYMVGVWLGDGTSSYSEITNVDKEILTYFRRNLKSINCRLNRRKNKDITGNGINKPGCNYFLNCLRRYNLINNKHIPIEYKINDRETRLSVLAGLIDTDGHLQGNCYEIIQINKVLANDILYLARSLGFGATISMVVKGCTNSIENDYYRVNIFGEGLEDIPVLLDYKKAHPRIQIKDALCTGIKIEPIGMGDYYGFSISGNRRYLMGDFTVTHNTLISLALIKLLQKKNKKFKHANLPKIHFDNTTETSSITTFKKNEEIDIPDYTTCTLITVPNNLLNHWKLEINKTDLKCKVINPIRPRKKKGQHAIPEIFTFDFNEYNIVLCPASKYNAFAEANYNIVWNRVMIDEADSIKIPRMRNIQYRFLWIITATYKNLVHRNQTGFVRNRFRDLPYHILHGITMINDEEYAKKSFALPDIKQEYVHCLTPHIVHALKEHIAGDVMEMINAGDINGAIVKMGGKVDSDRNIIKLITKNLRIEIKDMRAKIEYIQKKEGGDKRQKEESIKTLEAKIASKKDRIQIIKDNVSKITENNCPICYDDLDEPSMVPCCNNIFCTKCLIEWLKDKEICPMCRDPLEGSDLMKISDEDQPLLKKKKTKKKGRLFSKEKTLVRMIEKNKKGKYLIFSNHDATFEKILRELEIKKITYRVLNGALGRVRNTIDMFKKGDIRVVLLNAKYNGAGIDLSMATNIVIYHELPSEIRKQVIGRGQRVGRITPLSVHYLKYENEYIGDGDILGE